MLNHRRIVIIDPEEVTRSLITVNLKQQGYDVVPCATGQQALAEHIEDCVLVIMDINLPDMKGLDLLRSFKSGARSGRVPVMICTSADSEDEMIAGFDAGADDYIIKPFSLRVILAKVASLMRRYGVQAPTPVEIEEVAHIDGLDIDEQARTFAVEGRRVELTPTEWDILLLFVHSPNRLFPRDEIQERVWPRDKKVADRAVDVNISRLRKKMGAYAPYLVNRSGRGYGLYTKI
ncbi:MAG: response regulator transcription factor [Bacteroidales bacterium]|nr:response regulator transcription factor [Bacteroidales bacterium]